RKSASTAATDGRQNRRSLSAQSRNRPAAARGCGAGCGSRAEGPGRQPAADSVRRGRRPRRIRWVAPAPPTGKIRAGPWFSVGRAEDNRRSPRRRLWTAGKPCPALPAAHRAHLEWTPTRLVTWGATIGPPVAELMETMLRTRPHPEHGYR